MLKSNSKSDLKIGLKTRLAGLDREVLEPMSEVLEPTLGPGGTSGTPLEAETRKQGRWYAPVGTHLGAILGPSPVTGMP